VPRYSFVGRFLIVYAVRNETVYLSLNLIQKIRHLRRILFLSLTKCTMEMVTGTPALTPLAQFLGIELSFTEKSEPLGLRSRTRHNVFGKQCLRTQTPA